MPTYTVTGLALGAHKYGEAARVVTFLTRERGKVEATARGIGKPGSKLAAAVEPFTLAVLHLAEGKGLHRLSQAEVIEAFVSLRQDMRRYAYGATLLELTDLTCEPGEPLPGLFDDLVRGLQALVVETDPELVFWAFTLRLLGHLGSAPVLDACLECGGPLGAAVGHLPAEGGFVCRDCAPQAGGRLQVSGGALASLRALADWPWERLSRLGLSPDARREVNRVIRAHLAFHVTEELRSLKFLDQVTRHTPTAGGDTP